MPHYNSKDAYFYTTSQDYYALFIITFCYLAQSVALIALVSL